MGCKLNKDFIEQVGISFTAFWVKASLTMFEVKALSSRVATDSDTEIHKQNSDHLTYIPLISHTKRLIKNGIRE
jgi:hypothetical protein